MRGTSDNNLLTMWRKASKKYHNHCCFFCGKHESQTQKARLKNNEKKWLKENVKQGGEHGNQYKKVAKLQDVTLADIGVTKNESSRLQTASAANG